MGKVIPFVEVHDLGSKNPDILGKAVCVNKLVMLPIF